MKTSLVYLFCMTMFVVGCAHQTLPQSTTPDAEAVFNDGYRAGHREATEAVGQLPLDQLDGAHTIRGGILHPSEEQVLAYILRFCTVDIEAEAETGTENTAATAEAAPEADAQPGPAAGLNWDFDTLLKNMVRSGKIKVNAHCARPTRLQ